MKSKSCKNKSRVRRNHNYLQLLNLENDRNVDKTDVGIDKINDNLAPPLPPLPHNDIGQRLKIFK